MLGVAMYITIQTLYKQGLNKTEIARATKHDWKTVNKVIKAIDSGVYPTKKPHPSALDNYKEQILEYLESGLSGVRIHECLRDSGCSLGYSAIKNYIKELKGRKDIYSLTLFCVVIKLLPVAISCRIETYTLTAIALLAKKISNDSLIEFLPTSVPCSTKLIIAA